MARTPPTHTPIRLSRIVAITQTFGPTHGLALLNQLDHDHHLSDATLVNQRTHAVRAHLLTQLGDHDQVAAEFHTAAALTNNEIERRYHLHHAHHPDPTPNQQDP